MPAFLIDECVSLQTVHLFEALGLPFQTVHNIALSGKSDSAVFEAAQSMESVLVTLDRGFGDVRTYPPHSHSGIIVLRYYDSSSIQKCHTVLERLLGVEGEFKRTLFIVNENKYRKRK
jgi:predicted nuclease of predicted toxin-antitoxin system